MVWIPSKKTKSGWIRFDLNVSAHELQADDFTVNESYITKYACEIKNIGDLRKRIIKPSKSSRHTTASSLYRAKKLLAADFKLDEDSKQEFAEKLKNCSRYVDIRIANGDRSCPSLPHHTGTIIPFCTHPVKVITELDVLKDEDIVRISKWCTK